jgi:hypothetical protein
MPANVRGYKNVGVCVLANLSTVANLTSGLRRSHTFKTLIGYEPLLAAALYYLLLVKYMEC